MNDMENLRTFADQLWKYMVPKIDSKFASNVSYFRAKVKTNLGNNTLEVERPLETGTLTLPCTAAMSGATTGQQVTVLVMGSLSNAIVVGDGKMNFPYLPLTGGTLTGSLTMDQAGNGAPALVLITADGADGPGMLRLYKNASATADYGTMLIDYVWGNGSNTNKRTAVRVLSNAASLKDRLVMIDYAAGGSYVVYHLYGEHNQPTIADVTGLEARLTAIEDRLTALENG